MVNGSHQAADRWKATMIEPSFGHPPSMIDIAPFELAPSAMLSNMALR